MSNRTATDTARRKVSTLGNHERRHVPGLVLPFLARELIADLTPVEWKCWTVLFLHSNRGGFCCLKHETIVSESGIGTNSGHKAKRGLIKKGWLENCGQREFRGPNNYRIRIPIPKSVARFIATLWQLLNQESWWDSRLEADKFDYAEDHLDWLIAWRVVRTLKESDAGLNGANRESWTPQEDVLPELCDAALPALLDRLRRAAKLLNPERGIWWLFGDGFDLAER